MRRETFDENLGRGGNLCVQNRLTGERMPLSRAQFEDLVTMTFANSLEAFPTSSWTVRRNIRKYLRTFRDIAVPPAQKAFERCEARWWHIWK